MAKKALTKEEFTRFIDILYDTGTTITNMMYLPTFEFNQKTSDWDEKYEIYELFVSGCNSSAHKQIENILKKYIGVDITVKNSY